jgi:hypothetical protein
MRYVFHIFDGSELHPDDVGNNLPSLEYAIPVVKQSITGLAQDTPNEKSVSSPVRLCDEPLLPMIRPDNNHVSATEHDSLQLNQGRSAWPKVIASLKSRKKKRSK